MRITDLYLGMQVLSGWDLRLVFADAGQVWVPCASVAATAILKRYGASLRAAGWAYDDAIEAFVLQERS